MNDTYPPTSPPTRPPPQPLDAVDPALRAGERLGTFELQRVIARSSSTIVYLATDHALAMPVAIQEYLPARLVERGADQHLRAVESWQEALVARGLLAFIDEARMLAQCDHPALLRVLQLCEANSTAYRVMPFYRGQRLLDLRREMTAAPDEGSLRALLDGLLGALASIHLRGRVHGGVTPASILLLDDDRPLLLGPGAAGREIGSDLVASLMAGLKPPAGPPRADEPAATPPGHAADDLLALADVLRFCMTGNVPAPPGVPREHEPLAAAIAKSFAPAARPAYSASLLSTLDAASSPIAEDRPADAAQFREWLAQGPPARGRPSMPPPTLPADSAVDAMAINEAAWAPTRMDPPTAASLAVNRRPRKAMVTIIASLATAVLAVAAWVAWSLQPGIDLHAVAEPVVEAVADVRKTPADPPMPSPATPAAGLDPPVDVVASRHAEASNESALAVPPPIESASVPRRGRSVVSAAAAPPADTSAAAAASGPRALCAPRTEFALYRCMQTQCGSERWSAHPQCARLRATDQVE